MIEMVRGAAASITGPIWVSISRGSPILSSAAAKSRLDNHIAAMKNTGKLRWSGTLPASTGTFVAPQIVELGSASDLTAEHFGPILHVVRWKSGGLARLLREINAAGYGLTLGVHSRIDTTIRQVTDALSTGNIYVNRNIIGAVVGTQPFGGHGLSGTGPKAGGPNYLPRFAAEQVVTVNTAAAGGNASLMAMGE
jgi:RHH-type transcriptional regulator, proline utilization regulon repressor / proline dehydrogenase / delta 1-pyrroline-5-carboxylate dehydrogenase